MADDSREVKPESVGRALDDMKLEEGDFGMEDTIHVDDSYGRTPTPSDVKRSRSSTPDIKKSSQSPNNMQSTSDTPNSESDEEVTIEADITVTVEPGKVPKLRRMMPSKKVAHHPPPLFNELEDATEEAVSVFQVIKDCIYGSKYMGSSEHDSLDCDCSEEWNDGQNHACGENSDCINRATKMECVDGDCNCGRGCQNQRFQQKQYADVSVIKTEKKGYGLRVNTDLQPNDFIFEYIGEVINEPTFRRRTIQYDQEGIKHFYFMSLTKHEFVDATKKGNLGRFCNHSCNPNSYVDKWVVGEKLRMGIFAERFIQAGEELVFNYNVDRYGADPQPCYCGEPNCTGFIGGKTQTERATKLSHATIEALGIDDGDGWDTAVAKKPRKKKTGEDDEEYVNNIHPTHLTEDGVRKVMATLMQCKEKWIAVKLLSRIQRCNDDRVRNRVVQMHGYQILRSTLTTWKDDNNVVLQILDILYTLPRLTRNKISDSKIEAAVETLVTSEHEDIAAESKRLIEEWSKLEVAYRIPRKKFDPNAASIYERRNGRPEEVTKSDTPSFIAPTGPKSNLPQRNISFLASRPAARRPFNPLPAGWFTAMDEKGNPYFYSKSGQTTWSRPYLPAIEHPPAPKGPPKSVQTAKALQDIIDSITKPDPSTQGTPVQSNTADSTPKEKKPEKWRLLPQDKQMKLYENTLFPHVKHVMQKYTKKLPKEDLKKFAKEVNKKLVSSDFKNNRVENPTKISEKQEKKVKKYVRDFFDKAVEKRKVIDRRKREKEQAAAANGSKGEESNGDMAAEVPTKEDSDAEGDDQIDLTPNSPIQDIVAPSPSYLDTPDLKRKRSGDNTPGDNDDSEAKRIKEDDLSPPPPPPPPPADSMPDSDMTSSSFSGVNGGPSTSEETEEERELRLQEEDLMRENEEAMKMDMDGSLKVVEEEQKFHHPGLQDVGRNGLKTGVDREGLEGMDGTTLKREGMMSH